MNRDMIKSAFIHKKIVKNIYHNLKPGDSIYDIALNIENQIKLLYSSNSVDINSEIVLEKNESYIINKNQSYIIKNNKENTILIIETNI